MRDGRPRALGTRQPTPSAPTVIGMVALREIVEHLDGYLRREEVGDFPGAKNGLQVENAGCVTKIGAAVDACDATLCMAAERGIDLLIVHHGLFWRDLTPWTGPVFKRMRALLESNLAVYSSHLPLDVHPRIGNNVKLCEAMGLDPGEPFFEEKGQAIGRVIDVSLALEELVARLGKAVGGKVHVAPGGPGTTKRVGLIAGGAGSEIGRVAAEGIDSFVTGEAPHWAYTAAEDLGVNLLLGGHYATETFGVRALGEHLEHEFRLPWEFIDHPTGL